MRVGEPWQRGVQVFWRGVWESQGSTTHRGRVWVLFTLSPVPGRSVCALLLVWSVLGSGCARIGFGAAQLMGILESVHPAPMPNQGCAAGLQGGAAGCGTDSVAGFADLGSPLFALVHSHPTTRPQPIPKPTKKNKNQELRIGQGHLPRPPFPAAPVGKEVPAPSASSPRAVSVSILVLTVGDSGARRCRADEKHGVLIPSRKQKPQEIFLARLASPGRPTRAARAGSEWHGRGGAIWRSGNWGRPTCTDNNLYRIHPVCRLTQITSSLRDDNSRIF